MGFGRFGRRDADKSTATRGATYIIYGGDYRFETTHAGTPTADTLNGNATAELFAAAGRRHLERAAARTCCQGGAATTRSTSPTTKFFRVDGAPALTPCHLDFSGTIDFANLDNNAAPPIAARSPASRSSTSERPGQRPDPAQDRHPRLRLQTPMSRVASLDNVLKLDGRSQRHAASSKADGWGTTPDTTTLAAMRSSTVNLVRVASIPISA